MTPVNRNDSGKEKRPRRTNERSGGNRRPEQSEKRSYSDREERPRRTADRSGGRTRSEENGKRSYGDREERPRRTNERPGGRSRSEENGKRPYKSSRPERYSDKGANRGERSYSEDRKPAERAGRRSYKDSESDYRDNDMPKRGRGIAGRDQERQGGKKPFFKKEEGREERRTGRPGHASPRRSRYESENSGGEYSSSRNSGRPERRSRDNAPYDRKGGASSRSYGDRRRPGAPLRSSRSKKQDEQAPIRLNRYIARSGICSRREADDLIIAGEVKVNGVITTELGTKVTHADTIHVGDQLMRFERPVYLLLNKPKGYITTTDDPYKRKTVMALIQNACKENVFPVGRLDRNTTGLLLFTNDGDMAKKLTHPSGNIRKVYHVHLDKALTKGDMLKISDGLELEDGFIKVDAIAYVGTGADKKEVGIELHSGKNRIVRRIFESLGYEVVKLDRVIFANLTKKDLKRGHHRILTPQEVAFLKML